MKKLFNYALLAAALLIGVNVNAGNEVTVTIDGTAQPQWTTFADAMDAVADFGAIKYQTVTDGEKDQYKGQEIVITLNKDVAITKEGTTSASKQGWVIARGQNLTIDLNGYNITAEYVRFSVKQSILNIVGKGIIQNTDESINSACLIYVVGTMTDNGYDTKLYIGKDVTIKNSGYAVGVMYAKYTYGKEQGTLDTKYGYGVEITIAGTLDARYGFSTVGSTNFDHPASIDGMSIPKITLTETGVIRGDDELYKLGVLDDDEIKNFNNDYKKKHGSEEGMDAAREAYRTTASGIYAAGLAIWTINGRVEGGVGIYAKAGKFTINGAAILATSAEYHAPIFFSNGFIGAGSALVFDTNKDYPTAGKGVIIENSTISSDNGFGIEEIWTKSEGVDVPTTSITVVSGVISGGNGTAITTTPETREEIIAAGTITGGEWHGTGVENLVDQTVSQILEFTDANGKKYQVVVPIGADDWQQSIAAAADQEEGAKYAYVKADEPVTENTTVEFVRIAEGKTVTVAAGATLDAGVLMTEGDSKIVVEAGATLIVSGEQGAYTFDENSLLVETSEDNPGLLLINPAVVLNTTPKSTVKFISKAYKNSNEDYQFQYFGTPMVGQITSMTWEEEEGENYKTQLDVWNGSAWDRIGISDNDGEGFDYPKFEQDFGFYAILSNNPATKQLTYTIQGNLAGNEDAKIALPTDWNAVSNAYMGKLNKQAMLTFLKTQKDKGIAGAVYEYDDKAVSGYLLWKATNAIRPGGDIDPMQPIMLFNGSGEAQNVDLNYANLVYNPATGANPPAAPRYDNIMKATIRVKGCGMSDIVTVAEDGQFSSDFEDEFDAKKFDNKTIKFYVNADDEYDIYATDNIENTFVGFNTTKAGKYTISFEDVTGNFDLVDLKTNARINMVEGTTYEFLAEAGEDAYRFMIVEAAKAPTNTPATKAAVKATKALINDQIVISNGERFFNMLGTDVK